MGSSLGGYSNIVVVLDFDQTMIDVDTDYWVVHNLGSTTALFHRLLPTMPLNSLMDRMMKEVHSQGKTIEDIKEVQRRVPMHPKIVSALKEAHSLGCDLRILSDANTIFIDTVLEHVGLKECFSEIITNPSHVDEDGRLRISPYLDFTTTSPHGCTFCPPNLCKGLVIERIKASMAKDGAKKRMIYIGDGKGDFCPSLKLNENDFMMPRKGFPVWDLVCENRELMHAQVHEWMDGEDMNNILLKLIAKITSSN